MLLLLFLLPLLLLLLLLLLFLSVLRHRAIHEICCTCPNIILVSIWFLVSSLLHPRLYALITKIIPFFSSDYFSFSLFFYLAFYFSLPLLFGNSLSCPYCTVPISINYLWSCVMFELPTSHIAYVVAICRQNASVNTGKHHMCVHTKYIVFTHTHNSTHFGAPTISKQIHRSKIIHIPPSISYPRPSFPRHNNEWNEKNNADWILQIKPNKNRTCGV